MTRKVFWLIPAAACRAALEGTIMELARIHGMSVFAPHLTLGAAAATDAPELRELSALLKTLAPLTLETSGIGTGQTFSHSLFLEFRPCRRLDELMSRFPLPAGVEPHLSLLYCAPEQRDAGVCDAVEVPLPVMVFDEAWVVPMAGAVRTPEDVTRWRMSQRIRLDGNE